MGIDQEFEGIKTNIPGVYSKSEYPPSLGAIGAASNVVAIIGEAKGGVPHNASVDDAQKINVITSLGQAVDLLVGGPGFYMTEFYLTPTKEENLAKPSQCYFVRVNPATQAIATLVDASSDEIIKLSSTRYGVLANQISRKIEAGTNKGKKVTVKFKGSTLVAKDDIAQEYMELLYSGGGSPATVSINSVGLTTSCTGATTDDLSLAFADYPKLGDLVNYIHQQANYTCTLTGKEDAATANFDAVADVDMTTTAALDANVQALIDFFNDESGGEIKAELVTGADRDPITNDSNFVFLTGGSEGTTSNNHWAATLELLEKFKINHILVASGDSAIHAMVDTHIIEQSSIENRNNRSAGAGAGSSTSTKAARIAEMKALNSPRLEYWCTPFYRYDIVNGNVKKEFEPFYLSALGAGIRFGNHQTTTATFRALNILGIKEEYTRQDKKDYIAAGGSILERNERGICVVHNVSTYQGSNLILNLPPALRTADYITLDIQAKLTAMLNSLTKAPNSLVIKSIQNYIITNLLPGYVNDGLLMSDPNTGAPAFSDVEFSLSGDRFDVSFTGIVAVPLHFIFIKQKFIVVGFNS